MKKWISIHKYLQGRQNIFRHFSHGESNIVEISQHWHLLDFLLVFFLSSLLLPLVVSWQISINTQEISLKAYSYEKTRLKWILYALKSVGLLNMLLVQKNLFSLQQIFHGFLIFPSSDVTSVSW